MKTISKKKSFLREFFNECYEAIVLGTIMIYIVLSVIVGNLILPCINNGKEINPYIEDISDKFTLFLIKTTIGGLYLFGAIFILLFAFAIIGIIIIKLITGITHITAVKRYIYLPLTIDEVKEAINAGLFEDTPEGYTDYLTKQMKYFDGSVTFSVDDMEMITKTIKEIWNKSFKLNKDFLIRNKIECCYYLPFEFKDDRDDLFCQLNENKTVTFDMDEGSLIQDIR